MTKVLITGGTGLVGEHLQKVFLAEGYKVVILSRTNKKS
ncbi:MAG: NAD-dependent epimerase/dehydratase family protein, partial [Wenyingzhuangia sp.]